jgi:Carbohydrate family 9 binding domain-like
MKTLPLILLMATAILSCTNEGSKTYTVKKLSGEKIVVTGKGESPSWKNAIELADFIYPWENETAPRTSFKALHNSDWLYLFYQAKDENVQVLVKSNEKLEVIYSDRVEIFLRRDSMMTPYYGLELDANGRIYDYEATLPRKFNDSWSWPAGQLIVKTNRTNDGYSVEVAIGKESLKQLGLIKGNKLEAGLFRGECIELIDGSESKIKWISWVRPASPTPDFHIPSAFGILLLE